MRFFILALIATSFAAGIDGTFLGKRKSILFTIPDTPSFLGSYILTDSTLYEEYLEAFGTNFLDIQQAAAATPTMTISKNGDDWSISTDWTFETTEINFQLGQEFDEETFDDRSCKTTITQDGDNTLVHIRRCDDGSEMRIIRTFDGTVMTVYLPFPTGDNRVCIRIFHKIQPDDWTTN